MEQLQEEAFPMQKILVSLGRLLTHLFEFLALTFYFRVCAKKKKESNNRNPFIIYRSFIWSETLMKIKQRSH